MSALAWSAFSFFLGLLLGHRLALGRDKRKEFNELAAPLQEWVFWLEKNAIEYKNPPPSGKVAAFTARLSKRQRQTVEEAIRVIESEYENKRRINGSGYVVYTKTPKADLARERLWGAVKPK